MRTWHAVALGLGIGTIVGSAIRGCRPTDQAPAAARFAKAMGLSQVICDPLPLSRAHCSSLLNGQPVEFDCADGNCWWVSQ